MLAVVTCVLLAVFLASSAKLLRGSVELAATTAQLEASKRDLRRAERELAGSERDLQREIEESQREIEESEEPGLKDPSGLIKELKASGREMRVFERQLDASGLAGNEAALSLIDAAETELRASQALVRDPSPITGGLLTLAKKRVALTRNRVAQDARNSGEELPKGVQALLAGSP